MKLHSVRDLWYVSTGIQYIVHLQLSYPTGNLSEPQTASWRETLEQNVQRTDAQDGWGILVRLGQSLCSFPVQTCHLEHDVWGKTAHFSRIHGGKEKIVDRIFAFNIYALSEKWKCFSKDKALSKLPFPDGWEPVNIFDTLDNQGESLVWMIWWPWKGPVGSVGCQRKRN